ncbi:MAG TPA: hypothetical protein VGF97_17345 [Rhizomicrobium sp.]|jgi:hypothetical protein
MGTVVRFIGLLLIALALALLGADAITSLEKGGQITVRSVEQVWSLMGHDSVAAFEAWLNQRVPAPASGWLLALLTVPAWAPPGVLGVVIAFLFGRHPPDEA